MRADPRSPIVFALLTASLACSGGGGGDSNPVAPARVATSVQLAPATVALPDGGQATVTAAVLDQNGGVFETLPSGVTLTWSTDAPNIAAITGTTADPFHATVTAVHPGTAHVRVAITGTTAAAAVAVAVSQVSARLEYVAGQADHGTVGAPLPDSLKVRVVDRNSDPVPGVAVAWLSSTGSSVSQATTTTDSAGIARVRWTLATAAGPNTASATAPGLPPVTFTTNGLADSAAQISTVSGPSGSEEVTLPVAQPLVVKVTDRYGNLVAGGSVTWQVTAGGGTVNPATTQTANDGTTSTHLTLGTTTGANSVVATIGTVASMPFTVVAEVRIPASIELSTTSVFVNIGGTPGAITATVFDANHNEVRAASVDWTTTAPVTLNSGSGSSALNARVAAVSGPLLTRARSGHAISVYGRSQGSGPITATAIDGAGQFTSVVANASASVGDATTSLRFDQGTDITVKVGASIVLHADAYDANGNRLPPTWPPDGSRVFTWDRGDQSVITTSDPYDYTRAVTITGLSAGQTTVTVRYQGLVSGFGQATITVHVTE